MVILLPMDCDDTQEGVLVSLNEVKKWATIEIEEGQVVEIKFYDTREAVEEMVEAVVVISDNENVWPFIEEHLIVLVAHTQRSVDDIVEAFLFRELHELAF